MNKTYIDKELLYNDIKKLCDKTYNAGISIYNTLDAYETEIAHSLAFIISNDRGHKLNKLRDISNINTSLSLLLLDCEKYNKRIHIKNAQSIIQEYKKLKKQYNCALKKYRAQNQYN